MNSFFLKSFTVMMPSLLFFSLSSIAQTHSDFKAAADYFNAQVELLKPEVSHPRHLPVFKSHGAKTPVVFVLIPGLYGSPVNYGEMTTSLYETGNNVVAELLPGHWRKDPKSQHNVTFEEWQTAVKEDIALASAFGDKIVLVGHSLGGLLSIDYHLKNPGKIAALVLLTPAIKLVDGAQEKVKWANFLGLKAYDSWWENRLKGEIPAMPKYDGYDCDYGDLNAAQEIFRGIDLVLPNERRIELYRKINVPVFLVSAGNDATVDLNEERRFYGSLVPEKQHYQYFSNYDVRHYTVGMGKKDTFLLGPNLYNHDLGSMMSAIENFLIQVGVGN